MLNKYSTILINVGFLGFIGLIHNFQFSGSFFLPIGISNRQSIENVKLTAIGEFGLIRKARPAVPAHLHTGIDIKRPNDNYLNEPIYPIAKGIVISKKTNGPYAQLIIEHYIMGLKFWSLYEHIAGIVVDVHDSVEPATPIGRFMNMNELKKYGWQFDHVHLEILKVRPLLLKPDRINPDRYYEPYSLKCFLINDLEKYYHDPLIFLKEHFKSE